MQIKDRKVKWFDTQTVDLEILFSLVRFFPLIVNTQTANCIALITERAPKKEDAIREDRRKTDPSGAPPRGLNPAPRSGPGNRGSHPVHPPPGSVAPPGNYGAAGSHKDIKLTLLNKVNIALYFSVMVA